MVYLFLSMGLSVPMVSFLNVYVIYLFYFSGLCWVLLSGFPYHVSGVLCVEVPGFSLQWLR